MSRRLRTALVVVRRWSTTSRSRPDAPIRALLSVTAQPYLSGPHSGPSVRRAVRAGAGLASTPLEGRSARAHRRNSRHGAPRRRPLSRLHARGIGPVRHLRGPGGGAGAERRVPHRRRHLPSELGPLLLHAARPPRSATRHPRDEGSGRPHVREPKGSGVAGRQGDLRDVRFVPHSGGGAGSLHGGPGRGSRSRGSSRPRSSA